MSALGPAYELRAKLRPLAVSRRVADCGRRSICDTPAVIVRDYGEHGDTRRAWWSGVLQCGRQHSCPVCNARRAADRAAELDAFGRAGGRLQMVTLTIRHHRGEALAPLLGIIFDAWRRVRAMRSVRAIFDAHVTATARAVEVTGGWCEDANGWHPHIHLVLRSSEWSEEERATLERAWLNATDEAHRGEPGIAVVWSTPIQDWAKERLRYLAKLGAEVAGIGKQAWGTERGRLGPWQIAERALLDDEHAERWREYQHAMKGRRVLELDERAKALAATAAEVKLEVKAEWTFELHREEYAALARFERHEPMALWLMVEAALTSGPDPPAVLRSTLDDFLQWQKPLAA